MNKVQENKISFIVETALNLFLERGIEEVTIQDLAKELGIGEATIYRYFGKKENLVTKAAILLWEKAINKYFDYVDKKNIASGLEKVTSFLEIFKIVYENEKNFFLFIDEFDNYIINRNIPAEDISEYENIILSIKEKFDDYFAEGISDHSIKLVDKEIYYYTITHALLSFCKKLAKGRVLLSDSEVDEITQINLLISMFSASISNQL